MRISDIKPLRDSQVYAVTMDATHPACLPVVHTVNLRTLDWNGSCTCPTFTECCAFLLQCAPKKRQRCDHILAARQWMLEHEIPELLKTNIVVLTDYETEQVADIADTAE